ncbi:microsomal triglyceride transfer protein large subunit [Zerene cesonia]|uniref:microsomal triglyceride transfer protein large subunit n=1 Tax=Zerene cesonia TaxID=33412 RepID=UPI0018E514D4|nr:microsomal triglyceride transfer protein large subunit [Zerene cesonia]
MRSGISLFFLLNAVCVYKIHVNGSVTREDYGEVKLFQSTDTYDVETTVMLNEVSRSDKEVAYKIKATLLVDPVWKDSQDTEFLLKFELKSPHLLSRGKHVNADFLPHKSIWDSYPLSTFYAHWNKGFIKSSYLDLNELTDIVNFKRSLISLFQFQVLDGETNETDISGTCQVLYESVSANVIRKIKRGCEDWGGAGATRRVTRYTLDAAGVRELHAEEVHSAGGLKARAWSRLQRARSRPAAPASPASPASDLDNAMSAGEALWGAGAGGSAAAAHAALRVLPALCAAPEPRLARLLHAQTDPDALRALVGALGSCGSAGAHGAVSALLQLAPRGAAADAPAVPGLAHEYLAALALAPHPEESVVEEVVKLSAWPSGDAEGEGGEAGEAGEARELARSALLSAAAAARRLPPAARAARRLAPRLHDALRACADDSCRLAHVMALGNLASEESLEALLQQAERGAAGVAAAALAALERLPAAALLRAGALRRLQRLALAGRPLPARAAALDLLLRLSAPAPFHLPRLAFLLHERGPAELRRVLWQRLRALAAAHEPVALLLRMLRRELGAWPAELAPGTSSVLTRPAGAAPAGAARGWRAELDSVQLASRGVLRRGVVRLLAVAPDNSTDDTLTVELQASGLETFAGGAEDAGGAEGDAEEVGAVLMLSVAGVRMPPITLFEGQAQLLRLVWAGAGSEPTPALRALRALPRAAGAARLLDGRKEVIRLGLRCEPLIFLEESFGRGRRGRGARGAGAGARLLVGRAERAAGGVVERAQRQRAAGRERGGAPQPAHAAPVRAERGVEREARAPRRGLEARPHAQRHAVVEVQVGGDAQARLERVALGGAQAAPRGRRQRLALQRHAGAQLQRRARAARPQRHLRVRVERERGGGAAARAQRGAVQQARGAGGAARAALELRAGVALEGEALAAAAWGRLRAAERHSLEPRLRIAADLDFYDGVALCVRPRLEPAAWRARLALNATLGADGRGVRRLRRAAALAPGRTLSLGALNDAACRALGAPDE